MTTRKRQLPDHATKRIAVETDESAQLRARFYEQMQEQQVRLTEQHNVYKDRLARRVAQERAVAKAEKDDLERRMIEREAEKEDLGRRMIERDTQWQKHLQDVIGREKAEFQKAMEQREQQWQKTFEGASRALEEQTRQQERLRVEMEKKMTQNKEEELKRLEEHLAKTKVSPVLRDTTFLTH